MTFATEIAKKSRKPIFIITIEGIGEYTNSTASIKKWCTAYPDYITSNDRLNVYRPFLSGLSSFGEELDLEQNISKIDGLSFSLSRRSNEFDSFILGHKKPVTRLSAAVANATTTTISFQSVAWRDTGSNIFIGQECVVYNGTNYTRGAYGTTPSAHNADDPVFEGINYIRGRLITLYLVYNHTGAVAGDETQVWQGVVDRVSLSSDKTNFDFSCIGYASAIRHRSIFSGFNGFNVEFITYGKQNFTSTGDDTDNDVFLEIGEKELVYSVDGALTTLSFSTDRYYKTQKGEVIRVAVTSITGSGKFASARVKERALFGTQRYDDYVDDKESNVKAVEILFTDTQYVTQFRIQARGAETASVSTGTWAMSSHPIDILLCFLTSAPSDSAVLADGTFFTAGSNYTSGKGNYSSLPLGIGIGVLASKIDFDSFFYVKNLVFPSIRFDGFVFVGDNKESFLEWASKEILQPLGLYLTTNKDNKIQVIMIEHYNRLSTYSSLDRDDIISIDQEINSENPVTEVIFEMRTPELLQNKYVKETYRRNDLLSLYPFKESDNFQQRKKEFKLSGVRIDNQNSIFFEDLAIYHFQITNQAIPILTFVTDISKINTFSLGSYCNISDSNVLNPSTGVKGITSYACQIVAKRIVFPNKIEWKALMHHSTYRMGAISPAGIISSVTSWTPGNYVVVLEANNFSNSEMSGTSFIGYARDAAAFAAAYMVDLFDANGDKRSTESGRIDSVSTNTVTFSTYFGATITPAVGDVIRFATYSASDAAAQHNFTYMAADALTLGGTTDDPYQYH